MAERADLLFAGTGRWVVAVDRFTGRPVWRRKLPRFLGSLVTVMAHEDHVYVGRGGYVYCLDAASGEVVWERGIGSHVMPAGPVIMAVAGQGMDQQAAAAIHAQHEAAAAAAAASG